MTLPGNTPEEKLLLNHVVSPEGCWRWTGAHNTNGYGEMTVRRKRTSVHRLAHELWIGPIPDGHEIDHVRSRGCVHRDCLNPAHLEAVTHAENVRRKALNPRCIRGHEYTPENTFTGSTGHRGCRTCDRAAKARYEAKVRAARVPKPKVQGERHPAAVLTEAIVRDARSRSAEGERVAALADEYGVSKWTLYRAVAGTSWRHVDVELRDGVIGALGVIEGLPQIERPEVSGG